jgi:hypothetical protein
VAKAGNSCEVHLDAPELGVQQRVGALHRHDVRTDLAASFEYDATWRASENKFMLDPRLDRYAGEQHALPPAAAFGVLMDSAPDRWGQVLMERREAAVAERENRKPRPFQEVDFLLGVLDETRLGGLRLRKASGPFLDNGKFGAPPATALAELAEISRRIEEPGVEKRPEYERWLAMLIAPGTSLGGARPNSPSFHADARPATKSSMAGVTATTREAVDEVTVRLAAAAMLDPVDLEEPGRRIEPVGEGAHRDAAADRRAHALAPLALSVEVRPRSDQEQQI